MAPSLAILDGAFLCFLFKAEWGRIVGPRRVRLGGVAKVLSSDGRMRLFGAWKQTVDLMLAEQLQAADKQRVSYRKVYFALFVRGKPL